MKVPIDPVMWYKPQQALSGPGDINVPKSIQAGFIDYEVGLPTQIYVFTTTDNIQQGRARGSDLK
jgi:hypothetical protein